MLLNKNLKYIRKAHKITQDTLAIKLGVTRQTISKWENGQSVPDAEILSQIAEIFEVPVNELLGTDMTAAAHREKDEADHDKDSSGPAVTNDTLAELLATTNEQLAIKNKQHRTVIRIIKTVLIIIGIWFLFLILVGICSFVIF